MKLLYYLMEHSIIFNLVSYCAMSVEIQNYETTRDNRC
jgi:hypothetical protein